MKKSSLLLLGGNLGDRLANLAQANQAISQQLGEIKTYSHIYETAPWGVADQPTFLNQAIELLTELNPYELLYGINQIEDQLGRERHERWQARIIDIDILYYEMEIIDSQRLTVPHPHLHNRKFALAPLVDIAPNFVHPLLEKTNATLYKLCNDELQVSVFKKV